VVAVRIVQLIDTSTPWWHVAAPGYAVCSTASFDGAEAAEALLTEVFASALAG
jgi:hypothetical protein